jgi:Cu+-exporting ATPase
MDTTPVEEASAHPGEGVSARLRFGEIERSVLVGNLRLMNERGVPIEPRVEAILAELDASGETPLIVASDGQVLGILGARDTVRPEAHDVIHDLKHLAIKHIVILTGDRPTAAKAVAKKVHVKDVQAELLPADKARWVLEAQAAGRRVAMVGDGINDAPALAAAHVGIALGGIGADLASDAGDLVILGEPLRVLPDLVTLSRATVSVIRQNIILFAFGLNAVAMASAALGILGPVPAAILHQAGSLLVLLNAMRLLAFGDWPNMTPIRQIRELGRAITRLDDRLDVEHAVGRLLSRWRTLMATGLVVAAIGYATWGWTALGPGEVGLVRRLGRHVATLGPGLHLRLPPPFESVTRLDPDQPRSLEIGFRTDAIESSSGVRWESGHGRTVSARAEDEALLLTGDGRLVELAATAQYRLDRAGEQGLRAYAFGAADPDRALRPLAESSVRTVVGRRGLESLLTKGRQDAERAAAELLQQRTDACGLGLVVTGMTFQEVHPPLPVVEAYRDVSRAESDRQRRANEASARRSEVLSNARGAAAATVNRAEAERSVLVSRAAGEADAFRYIAAARSADPPLTDQRLYWEAVAAVLAGKSKLVLDPGQARPRHLILSEFPDGWRPPSAFMGPPKP